MKMLNLKDFDGQAHHLLPGCDPPMGGHDKGVSGLAKE